jgi:hypothetical protein
MIYPQSEEQRRMFTDTAKEEGRKLSPFILFATSQYIQQKQKAPKERLTQFTQDMARIAHAHDTSE